MRKMFMRCLFSTNKVLAKKCIIIPLPFDSNLTPENFEQKIKTYLNFQ